VLILSLFPILSEDVAMWTAEKRQISKFADNLQQLDNGVKGKRFAIRRLEIKLKIKSKKIFFSVPPRGWMCSKCDLKVSFIICVQFHCIFISKLFDLRKIYG